MSCRAGHAAGAPRALALMPLVPALALAVCLPSGTGAAAQEGTRSGRTVSLDFVKTDIGIVAKALSIHSRTNVVLLPGVTGQVTVRLIDVPVEEALRKVAAAVDADVVRIDDTYVVGTTASIKAMVAKRGVTATVSVQHLAPADAKALLERAFPLLSVESIGMTRVLVLAGRPDDVTAAQRMLARSDVEAPRAPVTPAPPPEPTRVTYAVKAARPEYLVEQLKKAVPELKVTVADRALILEGLPAAQQQADRLLAVLDVMGAGVSRVVRAYSLKYLNPIQASKTLKLVFPNLTVEAGFDTFSPRPPRFIPLGAEAAEAFQAAGGGGAGGAGAGGAQAGAAGGAPGEQELAGLGGRARTVLIAGAPEEVDQATQVLAELDVAPQQVQIEAKVVDISPDRLRNFGLNYPQSHRFIFQESARGGREPWQFGPFIRAPYNFDIVIDAFERERVAKILAHPNIAVVDGEEASIFIGDILRFERLAQNTAVGQTFTIETVPVGVALLVRPRVNADGKITIRVHPVVSAVRDFVGRNRDIPITTSREAESTILVSDGETIGIGGLLQETDIKQVNKIPFLGDLPFLGELFRSRSRSKTKSEVTIFLTVKLVKE